MTSTNLKLMLRQGLLLLVIASVSYGQYTYCWNNQKLKIGPWDEVIFHLSSCFSGGFSGNYTVQGFEGVQFDVYYGYQECLNGTTDGDGAEVYDSITEYFGDGVYTDKVSDKPSWAYFPKLKVVCRQFDSKCLVDFSACFTTWGSPQGVKPVPRVELI
jgi:hypothetical protein